MRWIWIAALTLLACQAESWVPSPPVHSSVSEGLQRQQPGATDRLGQAPPEASPATEASPRPEVGSLVPGARCLAIQPLGEVRETMLDGVERALVELYGLEIRRLEPVDLPESAWYEPRSRWRAERLLDFLETRLDPGCERILGVTTQDISTTKGEHRDWGILGLANLPGEASVISYYRCRRHVDEVPPQERLERVAVHEVGHSLGLPHCPSYGCYLEDAGGTVETIDRETFLCDVCRRRLGMPPR